MTYDKKPTGTVRKPYNGNAGYVASRKNPITGDHVVIYKAKEAGIDSDSAWAVVCEAHNTIITPSNRDLAYVDMKQPSEWCEDCRTTKPGKAP